MKRQGFALLAALWLLTTLSIVALALAAVGRTRRLAAANLAESVRARAAAAAGIERIQARLAARLARGGRIDPWGGLDSLSADTLVLEGASAVVTARDVGAALNLNGADETALQRLFVALRVDAGDADRLAQAIADWRDSDDLHRARGAEADAYLAADAPLLPRNGPFQAIAELAAVRGMTPELFELASPYLTLLGSSQINLNTAPRAVLLTLPGVNEEVVAVLLRYRRQGRVLGSLAELERSLSPGSRAQLVARMPQLMARAGVETREVAVTSEGWLTGSPVRVRMTGLLVQARGAMFYVWSRAE